MIRTVTIKDDSWASEILFFKETDNFHRMNILMGPNGSGKSTFLRVLNKVADEKGYEVLKYVNSTDSLRAGASFDFRAIAAAKIIDSEGEALVTSFLDWIERVKESITPDKTYVILIDEIDSGLSVDGASAILGVLSKLLESNENVQLFFTANSYYFAYAVKKVFWVMDGKFRTFTDFENFFEESYAGKMKVLKR